jgi:hypothetical protein
MPRQPLNVTTNASDIAFTRYSTPENGSTTLTRNLNTNEQQFRGRFNDLVKPGHVWLDYNRLPIRPNGQLGIDHYEPLDTRVVEYFGLKTSSHPNFWPWPKDSMRKRYTLNG